MFTQKAKQMQQFLTKFIDQMHGMQKKFDENLTRAASLNKFLYEYEVHSVAAYSPKVNTYLGRTDNLPDAK